MSSSDPFGLIGHVLDGQFRVDKYVGEGGFSTVYRAHHVGLEEPVAIKCLKLPMALGSALVESFVQRFREESRLQYRLSQGNLYIVRTLAHGTTMAPATGALVPYMALEWLEGRSLAAELAVRRARGEKGMTLPQTVELLDSAVDALAYAHASGVVHRDVNPGNLFLAATPQGVKLKVLDFGVAKVMHDHSLALGPRTKTIGQIRIFSPQYASPEQFDDAIGPVGPWSDVYSIALVAIELLRDRPAIDGDTLGDFALRALDPKERPSPRRLGFPIADEAEAIFKSAVALSPKDRPQDAGELWGSLKHAMRVDTQKGNALVASPPKRGSTMPPPSVVRTLAIDAKSVVPAKALASDKELPPDEDWDLPPETTRMAEGPAHVASEPPPHAVQVPDAVVNTPMPAPIDLRRTVPLVRPAAGMAASVTPPPGVLLRYEPAASQVPPQQQQHYSQQQQQQQTPHAPYQGHLLTPQPGMSAYGAPPGPQYTPVSGHGPAPYSGPIPSQPLPQPAARSGNGLLVAAIVLFLLVALGCAAAYYFLVLKHR